MPQEMNFDLCLVASLLQHVVQLPTLERILLKSYVNTTYVYGHFSRFSLQSRSESQCVEHALCSDVCCVLM